MRKRAMGSEFTIRKSARVRVNNEKEQWGKGSPSERAMGLEFTMRERAMV